MGTGDRNREDGNPIRRSLGDSQDTHSLPVHKTRFPVIWLGNRYVRRNWEAEIGTEQPEDPAQMVQAYFAEALEAYEIVEN